MKDQEIKFGKIGDEFFSLLDGKIVETELAKLRKSKNITINQLKSIFDVGVFFYNNLQFKEAEIIFCSYVGLNPYDHRGVGCLAAIYLEQGKFKKALNVLNILKTYPTNDIDETILNIALCHYKLNEHLEAAATLLIVKADTLNDFYTQRFEYLQKQLTPYLS
ncbi:CDC27 family protein [Vibrio mediterranei]|uniref:Regulator n=1 Tax=Vibrio mediterranei TaxID=689 RepID=A0A3G4VJR4_9VIBR|nr:regulator [Vibrio mediterranei]AYV25047.1 regulator [Vibrio mediterranei]MCG9790533.1 CDC27 family protein [Vibrio mediterranei]